jgi:carbon monoxide dehydrogenase subunit G
MPGMAGGATQAGAHVHAPKRGQYVGETRQRREATLYVARRSIRSAVFEVDCGLGSGRTTLRRLKLRATKRGFTLAAHRQPRIAYNDGHAPETATVVVSGRFGRTGRKAHGVLRVHSRHCGGSGKLRWSARYASPPVRTPKSGQYVGETKQRRFLGLSTSGPNVQLAELHFKCGTADGSTVLNDIDMHRTFRGFAFELRAHGSVTYSDGYPDENAEVDISGLFSRSGSKAHGWIRVKSPRCGGTGRVGWAAKRRRSG